MRASKKVRETRTDLTRALVDPLKQVGAYEVRIADPTVGYERALQGQHPSQSQQMSWPSMSQSDPRPYFSAYLNGKSAVRVHAGVRAAGVHSWALAEPYNAAQSAFVAGPSILHFHFASRKAFRDKYLHIAAGAPPQQARPFPPSPAEAAAVGLIRSLQDAGADDATIARRLDALHGTLTGFSGLALELLEDAGLLLTVDLEHTLSIEQ